MKKQATFASLAAIVVLGLTSGGLSAHADPAPSNGKITFSQGGPDDATTGYTINPDGSHQHQVGPATSVSCVGWAPDGSKVLCNFWSSNGPEPATANPDGSGYQVLNSNLPFDLFCLFWSPNGARLICHSEGMSNPGDAGLYSARSADVGGLVRLTATPNDGSADTPYGYSSDGSHVLWARFPDPVDGVLYSTHSDGTGKRRLTPPGLGVVDPQFFDSVGASWSPDGSRATFAGTWKSSPGRQTALYVVNADGTRLRQVTPPGLGALSAQWSPNGRWIAFSGKRFSGDPPWQIWVVHPDGTGLRAVTSAQDGTTSLAPVWSPDSTKLLFNRVDRKGNTSLSTINANGTGLFKVTDLFGLSAYAWGTAPTG